MITTEEVLDGPGHDMVDSRLSIGRRGAFIKYKTTILGALVYAFLKDLVLLPESQDFPIYRRKV
jgi:hypothetical protein